MLATRRSVWLLIEGLVVFTAGLVFLPSFAAGQDETRIPKQSDQQCCWIDIKTGKRVPTVPASGINYGRMVENLNNGGAWADPGVAILSEDRTSATNTRTGQRYEKDSDGCWIDIKTGKRVPTAPASGINYGRMVANLNNGGAWADPGVAVLGDDRNTARDTRTKRNYAREACPPPKEPQTGFKSNQIDFKFGLIREDTDPRFNIYGFNGTFTRYVNPTFGLTGDFNANFKSEGGTDIRKISALGGFTFVPFEGMRTTDKVTISSHALFGASRLSSDNGTTNFTDNAFTMKLGGALDVNVNPNFFIRPVQIDYAPTFFGGNTQHNFQVGFGGGLRF